MVSLKVYAVKERRGGW